GASGIVPAGGRCTTTPRVEAAHPGAVAVDCAQAGPVLRLHFGSGDDITVGEATGLSPPSANRSHPMEVHHHMLRLQSPLPERYTAASPDDLCARIAAAKDALGDRLFVLGHHYQRDEIIRFADARGDSFRLSVLAQQ